MSTNLSIIILAHRIDGRLEKSLRSAQFASDVIVIDNQSVGDWSELRKQYQFRVIPYSQRIEDWSVVRNQAIQHALHDWVFFLDSDEEIVPASIPAIQTVVKSAFFTGAIARRSDIFYLKQLRYGEAGNIALLRLGKKNHITFNRPVHEEASIDGPISTLDINILHHSHLSIEEFLQKVMLYAQLEAKHRHAQGAKLFIPTMLFFPIGKFLLNYIGKLGFLDGWQGFIYAFLMSLHSLFVLVYQFELERQQP